MTIDTSREAVERLLDDVTPGPWRVGSWGDNVFGTGPKDEWLPICRIKRDDAPIEDTIDARDARFIAAARGLVPALLAERDDMATLWQQAEMGLASALAERDAALAEVARLSTPPDDAEVAGLVAELGEPLVIIEGYSADYVDTDDVRERMGKAADAITRLSHAHAAAEAERRAQARRITAQRKELRNLQDWFPAHEKLRWQYLEAIAELAAEKDAHAAERKLADDLARAGGFARTALSGLIRPEIAINALDSVLDAHAARRKPLTKGCLHTTPCTCGYPE